MTKYIENTNRISGITKREIFEVFKCGIHINDSFYEETIVYPYYGILSELDFLSKLYPLDTMESYDSRFKTAKEDIFQHTVNNDDYPTCWVFEDDRFKLKNGPDKIYLDFICMVFNPEIRDEEKKWDIFLNRINDLLKKDGYCLYVSGQISGHNKFSWKTYNQEDDIFIPFSIKHRNEIIDKAIKFSMKLSIRQQILGIIKKHDMSYEDISDDGSNYKTSFTEDIFKELSTFYVPSCYNENGQYVRTDNIDSFIMHTSPYCVLDAIQCFNSNMISNDFENTINAVFKANNIPYLLNGKIIETSIGIAITEDIVSSINENGLRALLEEAINYRNKGELDIATEKLWDAFERLKTYYPSLSKKDSTKKIILSISESNDNYFQLLDTEFLALTQIGNSFRIRHHETNKINIQNAFLYEYFFNRCLSLILLSINYLS